MTLEPIASGVLTSSKAPYEWHVFLWRNQADFIKGANPEKKASRAMCLTDTYLDEDQNPCVVSKLGEIHFVSGNWTVNTVTHEVIHGLLHRLRYVEPTWEKVIPEFSPEYDISYEETIAYEGGDWVEVLLSWLTENDPESKYPASFFTHTSLIAD